MAVAYLGNNAIRKTFDPQCPQLAETLELMQRQIQGNSAQSSGFRVLTSTWALKPDSSTLAVGTFLIVKDRGNVVYVVSNSTGVSRWTFAAGMMTGTFAARPNDLGATDAGFEYYANADSPSYNHVWRWSGTAWVIQYGLMTGAIADKPTGLGTEDAGFRFYETTYKHTYLWSGAAFGYDPEDDGAGYFQEWGSDPSRGVWHLCNGATGVKQSFGNLTESLTVIDGLANGVLPDFTTAVYAKLGTSNSLTPSAASGATSADSAGTPTGTVSQPTFAGDTVNTGANLGSTEVQSGTGTTVASDGHTHETTPTGTVSQPTFTGDAMGTHSHSAGTLELRRVTLKTYYRL